MSDHSSQFALEGILGRAAETGVRWGQRRSGLVLNEKSAGQLVSSADVEIEAQIRNDLSAAFPGDAIIGEELGGSLGLDTTGWAIDPIDGTSNFVLGLPFWGISVGYVARGRSMLGAIALPEFGLILSASHGNGLKVCATGPVPAGRPPSLKVMALGENDYESGSETDARAQSLRDEGFAVVRYRCAVVSLGLAAIGRLSGYLEHGCGLWDIAAAEVICREAGMNVQTAAIAEGRYAIDARWPC